MNRVSVRELVSLAKDVALFIEQHGLGRSRTAVDPDEPSNRTVRGEGCGREVLTSIGNLEVIKFRIAGGQTFGARLGLLFLPSVFDVVNQLFVALVASDGVFLALTEFNGAQGGEVLRVLRNLNKILRLCAVGDANLTLLPHAGNVRLPGFPHPANKTVWATEQ